jgi:hypothetical protein
LWFVVHHKAANTAHMQQGAYQKQFNFTCEGIRAAANSSKPQVHKQCRYSGSTKNSPVNQIILMPT